MSSSVNRNIPPPNDCVFSRLDITAMVTGVDTSEFTCNTVFYNPLGQAALDGPTADSLDGDPNGCTGLSPVFANNTEHRDVWFAFNLAGDSPDVWVSAYQPTGSNPAYIMSLYSGTPTGTFGPGGLISGLSQIDCSNGDIDYILTGNEHGGARDKGVCTTPLHPRIDLSNLPAGQYYIRVWEAFGGHSFRWENPTLP